MSGRGFYTTYFTVHKNLDSEEKVIYYDQRFEEIGGRFVIIEGELQILKKIVLKIEQEHGEKLQACLDGWKSNNDQLNRIEKEVMKHDEFIIRRVKLTLKS